MLQCICLVVVGRYKAVVSYHSIMSSHHQNISRGLFLKAAWLLSKWYWGFAGFKLSLPSAASITMSIVVLVHFVHRQMWSQNKFLLCCFTVFLSFGVFSLHCIGYCQAIDKSFGDIFSFSVVSSFASWPTICLLIH